MSQEELKRRIKQGVWELIESEPNSLSELMSWSERAVSVKELMASDVGDIQIPHALWHYLDDADIRLKDDRYAVEQIKYIKTIMDQW